MIDEKKPCPNCGSVKIKRNNSTNHIAGMGYVSNSYEHCEKCGHFEVFGPRW